MVTTHVPPTVDKPSPLAMVSALPHWKGHVDIKPLSGGVSNASFAVTDATGAYVARVGKDYPFHQVNREREAAASRAAFTCGLSPELLFASDGLSVLRFIEGLTYTAADVRANWLACLDLVQRTHRDMGKHITGQGAIFWVFQILRDYARQLTSANHRLAAEIPRWLEIVDSLESAQIPMPIVFGHHDLLAANFMHDSKRLWLIDWEYGAFGTPLFDLANLAANNSFDALTEQDMLRHYFGKPDQAIQRAFAAMKVASALREALWGMVSELNLNAPGVDYVAYAHDYLARFDIVHADYCRNFR